MEARVEEIHMSYSEHDVPYLALFIGDRTVPFLVDTGTDFTVVTPRQVERLGQTDQVQPSEDAYYDGVVNVDIYAYKTFNLVAKDFRLYVR